MSLKLLQTDFTQFPCDAAVVLTDDPAGAAGCETGQARCTEDPGGMRAKKCIVAAAPVWQDGLHGETVMLAQCVQNSLDEAVRCGCKKIGILLNGARAAGFPQEAALETAVQTIHAHPQITALDVYLITSEGKSSTRAKHLKHLERYIRQTMRHEPPAANALFGAASASHRFQRKSVFRESASSALFAAEFESCESAVPLAERLNQLDEGFSQMLMRLIDEAGMKDSECYKKANVSRQLFSKIRSDPHYRPKKETVLAFALALQLDLDKTNALLRTAGFSLSHSSKFDVIIEYFIGEHIYNVFIINEALYQYDQPVLGSD